MSVNIPKWLQAHKKFTGTALAGGLTLAVGGAVMANSARIQSAFNPASYAQPREISENSPEYDSSVFGYKDQKDKEGLELNQDEAETKADLEEGQEPVLNEEKQEIAILDVDTGTSTQGTELPDGQTILKQEEDALVQVIAHDDTSGESDGGNVQAPVAGGTVGVPGPSAGISGDSDQEESGNSSSGAGGSGGSGSGGDTGGTVTPNEPATPEQPEKPEQPVTPADPVTPTEPTSPDSGKTDPDDDKYGVDDTPEIGNSEYPSEEMDNKKHVTATSLTVTGSLMQHFYEGEVPRISEMSDYITVNAEMSDGTGRTGLIYNADYAVDWDLSKTGTRTATISYRGKSCKMEYDVVKWTVRLWDFDYSDSTKAYGKLYRECSPGLNRKVDIRGAYGDMCKKIGDRTEGPYTYQFTEDDYTTTLFSGWSDTVNGSPVGGIYIMPRPEDSQVIDGAYQIDLFPIWTDLTESDFKIAVPTPGNGRDDQRLMNYTGNAPEIKVPTGTTEVLFNLFDNDVKDQVADIQIPVSVSRIAFPQFGGINGIYPNLKAFSVDADNQFYLDIDGILYDKTGKTLLSVPGAKTEIEKWSKNVTALGTDAFAGTSIREITIPENITSIGENCFLEGKFETIELMASDSLYLSRTAFFEMRDAEGNLSLKKLILHATQVPELEQNTALAFASSADEVLDAGIKIQVPDSVDDQVYLQYLRTWGPKIADSGMTYKSTSRSIQAGQISDLAYLLLETEQGAEKRYRYENSLLMNQDGKSLLYFPKEAVAQVDIPDGVETICSSASKEAAPVSLMSFPKTLKKIETGSLPNLSDTTFITFYGDTPPELGTKVFGGKLPENIMLYVPEGQTQKYVSTYKAQLDTEYSKGTAEKIIHEKQGELRYINKSLYLVQDGDAAGKEVLTLLRADSSTQGTFTFAEGTVAIDDGAFADCVDLQLVIIPDTVKKLGTDVFKNCSSLRAIAWNGLDVPEWDHGADTPFGEMGADRVLICVPKSAEAAYRMDLWNTMGADFYCGSDSYEIKKISQETVLQGISDDGKVLLSASTLGQGGFILDLDVVEIYGHAFEGCRGLSGMTTPAGSRLQRIGEKAFYQSGILSADWGNAAGLTEIGDEAFAECEKLGVMDTVSGQTVTNIYIPSVRVIGEGAFRNCTNLQGANIQYTNGIYRTLYFPNLRSIGKGAFAGCSAMEYIHVTDALAEFPDECFMNCGELKQVFTSYAGDVILNNLQRIGKRAFYNSGITYINYGNYNKWITIDDEAFAECKDLGVFYIPSLRSIGARAFQNCSSIWGINFTVNNALVPTFYALNAVSIGEEAFEGCGVLQYAWIPTTLTEIPTECFKDCTSLKMMDIRNLTDPVGHLTSLGARAFEGCKNLTKVMIPESLKVIGEDCFNQCTSVVTAEMNVRFLDTYEDWMGPKENLLQLNIWGDLDQADVSGLTGLSLITLGNSDGVTKTYGGENLFAGNDTITFASAIGLTELEPGCFKECRNLSQVTWYALSKELPDDCFSYCTNLTSVGWGVGATNSLVRIGDRVFDHCAKFKNSAEWYNSTAYYKNLREVGDAVYRGCTSITGYVWLNRNIEKIGDEVFKDCTGLANDVYVFREVTSIGDYAFEGCKNIKRLYIGYSGTAYPYGKLHELGSGAFKDCTSLQYINIYGEIHEIGDDSFHGCTSLLAMQWFSGCNYNVLERIGDRAFYNCQKLQRAGSVYNRSGWFKKLTYVGEEAYANCSSLMKGLPETGFSPVPTVETYGKRCYANTDLTTLVLPDNMMVSEGCFENCTSLEKVTADSDVKAVEPGAFDGCTSLSEFTVKGHVGEIPWDQARFDGCSDLEYMTIKGDRYDLFGNKIIEPVATPGNATPSDATPSDATPSNATSSNATPHNATWSDATPGDATASNATGRTSWSYARVLAWIYGEDEEDWEDLERQDGELYNDLQK